MGYKPRPAEENAVKLQIMPYSDEHREGIHDLILPIQQEEFDIPITYEDQPDLQDIFGFYRHGKGEFWVAVFGPEIVGSIALVDIGNDQAALRKMFVKKNIEELHMAQQRCSCKISLITRSCQASQKSISVRHQRFMLHIDSTKNLVLI